MCNPTCNVDVVGISASLSPADALDGLRCQHPEAIINIMTGIPSGAITN